MFAAGSRRTLQNWIQPDPVATAKLYPAGLPLPPHTRQQQQQQQRQRQASYAYGPGGREGGQAQHLQGGVRGAVSPVSLPGQLSSYSLDQVRLLCLAEVGGGCVVLSARCPCLARYPAAHWTMSGCCAWPR